MTLPPRSAWRRLEREPAARSAFSFLGRAYFSEWSLLSTFPGFLPLFRSFYSLCSLSCAFFFLKGIQRLMLCGFRSQIRGLTLQEARCAIRGKSKHISLQTAKAESEDASMRYNDHNAQETYE